MLIIFDLDGTLINTIDDLGQACNHALSACGFPTHEIADYPRLVGNGINKLIERALPEEHRNEATVLRLREHFVPYYDAHNCDLTHPYDGVAELLQTLKAAGHTLAVASNKYQAATVKLVKQYFPNINFVEILGQREGINVKPDPTIVFDILKKANVSREETLYVGDSGVDMQTAINAGVDAVGVTWGFRPRAELENFQPMGLIDKAEELLEFI